METIKVLVENIPERIHSVWADIEEVRVSSVDSENTEYCYARFFKLNNKKGIFVPASSLPYFLTLKELKHEIEGLVHREIQKKWSSPLSFEEQLLKPVEGKREDALYSCVHDNILMFYSDHREFPLRNSPVVPTKISDFVRHRDDYPKDRKEYIYRMAKKLARKMCDLLIHSCYNREAEIEKYAEDYHISKEEARKTFSTFVMEHNDVNYTDMLCLTGNNETIVYMIDTPKKQIYKIVRSSIECNKYSLINTFWELIKEPDDDLIKDVELEATRFVCFNVINGIKIMQECPNCYYEIAPSSFRKIKYGDTIVTKIGLLSLTYEELKYIRLLEE